jgi:hypothetical protein
VPAGQGVHIQPPAERSSKQSVQQEQRTPRTRPQIMERLAIDFHRISFNRHVLLYRNLLSGTTTFSVQPFKSTVIASVASRLRDFSKRVPHFLLKNPSLAVDSSQKSADTKTHMEIPILIAFLSNAIYTFVSIGK